MVKEPIRRTTVPEGVGGEEVEDRRRLLLHIPALSRQVAASGNGKPKTLPRFLPKQESWYGKGHEMQTLSAENKASGR